MNKLNLSNIERYVLDFEQFEITSEQEEKVKKSFSFLKDFASDKIIYGINTGFGPMAQFKIDKEQLDELQYNLIRSHSSGTGDILDDECSRAILVARLNNFLQGNSGISFPVVEILSQFLNHKIYPEIYAHGGVGASGDLVQLAHLGLNLIGEGYVRYNNERRPTKDVLVELSIRPLELKLRDGLGLINGTSCMTGIGAINLIHSNRLLNWSILSSSVLNEVVEAYDDSFSTGLNSVKHHEGQQFVAEKMRTILSDSTLIRQREELFKDHSALGTEKFKKKIQEYYSIRCVPQILGPVKETIDYAKKIIENEINSTNDNPIVSVEDNNVFHGGNFHGDYVSLEMDKLKIVITRLTMLAERQLNFLMNSNLNDHFPPFLNTQKLGLNFGIQGMQFTATSTTAESQMLSNSMYVHSITNNNDNQDIVSMGTNSAVIAKQVIENGFQVMAIHMMAICQAIDLLSDENRKKISSKTQKLYDLIRTVAPTVNHDVPQFENIKEVKDLLKKTTFNI